MRAALPIVTRLLAILVALSMVAAGVFLLAELVAAVFGNDPVFLPADYTDRLRSTGWDDASVRWVSLGLGIAALVLLIGALWPRPPLDIEVQLPGMLAERRSVEATARRRVEDVDGVDGARVRADVRHLSARVSTNRRHRPDLVQAAVEQELRDFIRVHELPITPLVSVRSGDDR
jgi:hypothetical protein